MVNYPEFHLNDPFTLTEEVNVPAEKKQDLLNQMWRNQCISDTYEPGSTFKIITAAAALEQGGVKLTDNFYCPGYKLVEDRRIRCAKTTGHGAETFETGIMNSSSYQRINVMANLSATPSEKLRMDMQLYGAYVDRSRNTRHALNHNRFEHLTVQPT